MKLFFEILFVQLIGVHSVWESLSQKNPPNFGSRKLVFSPFFSNPIVHNFADSDWKSKFSLVTAASEAVLLTLFVTITSVYKTHNWLNYEKSTISKSTSWIYDYSRNVGFQPTSIFIPLCKKRRLEWPWHWKFCEAREIRDQNSKISSIK